jgi:hypothetical protein
MRVLQILAIAAGAAVLAAAITPTTTSSQAKTKAKSATAKKAVKKRYLSSSGKTNTGKTGSGKAGSGKASTGKTAAASSSKPPAKPAAPPTTRRNAKPAPKAPAAIKPRVLAHDAVYEHVASGAEIPVENPAALIPFFEQLYRHQQGKTPGPVRILHYGDSHTAADEWTGEMRARLQEKFGDGGSGYSFAGRPWNGYRREDVRSGSTSPTAW